MAGAFLFGHAAFFSAVDNRLLSNLQASAHLCFCRERLPHRAFPVVPKGDQSSRSKDIPVSFAVQPVLNVGESSRDPKILLVTTDHGG
jgi:hypothetical protein